MEENLKREPLRILHLEDNPHDTEIIRIMLEEERIPCLTHRVETREEFERALEKKDWNIIISDFSLPSYDGLKALAFVRQKCPATPFILFSGTIGEEMAVQSLKSGAADYILKHRPERLMTAVRHALKEADDRERRLAMEEKLWKSEERKKQLEAQFLRMQRMESIGSLASGIAHDLNNALVPVLMGIGYLQDEPQSEEAKHILTTMNACARRGAEMVKQVLTFARGTEGTETLIRVDSLIREMSKIVHDLFPKSVNLRMKIGENLWQVSGYATQLHQVLMNLCVNARDAMPQGGQLTLAVENLFLNEEQIQVHPDAHVGQYLRVIVSDTGTGIRPEMVDKIFQPFFTTKDSGKGTGLGLSTSLNIVKNHGGFILVKSELGKGTVFSIYLPAIVTSVAVENEQRRAKLPAGHGELILVIDDEAAICEITKATLENYGYRVLVATGGPEGIALFADRRGEIKLAITDTEMPLMDGRATCLALRKMDPHLKIIAASGYPNRREEEDTSFQAKINSFIPKPYTMEKLLTTVHGVLNLK
jgi:two-component system cell cycle sensor histidine kinase/response regulator CckA